MPCENAAQSNDYFEFIGEYSGVLDYVKEEFNTECITVIDQRFAIAYVKKNGRTSIYGQNYPYNTIPRCFGLMDTQMLEDVGVAQVRRSTLDLYGNGVLVGMIDTGIDYEHPAFRYEDGSSKIYSLWDQTIEGDPEDTFLGYGTEYTKEQIEEALKSDVPQQKVPSKDESGHGTFLAGLIAGNEDNETGFSGIAPNAGLVVVKLRKAKDYLKEYYCIDPKYEAYAETDIMLAVHYIDHIAEQLQRPIVIFLGIGTNLASHLGTGPLDQYLSGRAMLRGVAVVTSAGNEGQARHHYSGQVSQNDAKVEVKVGESEYYNTMLYREGPAPHPLPGWLARDIIARHLASPSMLCILSVQDWLAIDEKLRLPDAEAERINIPANPKHYWRYRMHLSLEELAANKEFMANITELVAQGGRN